MTVLVKNKTRFRAEDLLKPGMPEKFVEVIEGELIVMTPAGWEHDEIAYHFHKLFDQFCEKRPDLHFASSETGYLLQRDPDVLLCPDASVYRFRERKKGPWLEFAPAIAVEIISPSNNAAEIAYKRAKYFKAGAEQVWIARPESKTIEFHHCDGRGLIVQGDEIARGEGIAEGMEIDLPRIFSVRHE